METQSLNHWTAREVPSGVFFVFFFFNLSVLMHFVGRVVKSAEILSHIQVKFV